MRNYISNSSYFKKSLSQKFFCFQRRQSGLEGTGSGGGDQAGVGA